MHTLIQYLGIRTVFDGCATMDFVMKRTIFPYINCTDVFFVMKRTIFPYINCTDVFFFENSSKAILFIDSGETSTCSNTLILGGDSLKQVNFKR